MTMTILNFLKTNNVDNPQVIEFVYNEKLISSPKFLKDSPKILSYQLMNFMFFGLGFVLF